MVDDGVAVLIEQGELGISGRAGLVGRPVDLVAAGVLALPALGREEDRIVVATRVVVGLVLVVLPLLNEEDACLGSGVRLEGVAVETHDGENPATFGDVFADFAVELLKRPWGRTMAMRPPAPRKLMLRSMKRMSRLTLFWGLPFFVPSS